MHRLTFAILVPLFVALSLTSAEANDDSGMSEMPLEEAAEKIINEYDNSVFFMIDGKKSVAVANPKFKFPKVGMPIDGTSLKIGDQIEIKGKLLSGKSFELKNTRKGSATLVVFWSTTCSACLTEFPVEKAFFVKYKDRGLRVVAINSDSKISQAKRTRGRFGLPWQTVFDGDDGPIVRNFNVTSWPTLLLLDHNRKILHATHVESGGLRSQSTSPPKFIYQKQLTMSLAKLFPPVKEQDDAPELPAGRK